MMHRGCLLELLACGSVLSGSPVSSVYASAPSAGSTLQHDFGEHILDGQVCGTHVDYKMCLTSQPCPSQATILPQ